MQLILRLGFHFVTRNGIELTHAVVLLTPSGADIIRSLRGIERKFFCYELRQQSRRILVDLLIELLSAYAMGFPTTALKTFSNAQNELYETMTDSNGRGAGTRDVFYYFAG